MTKIPSQQSIKARADIAKSRLHSLLLIEQLRPAFRDDEIVVELVFHADRRWRFDVAIPDRFFAVEIEGGVFSRTPGRHTRGSGFMDDCEKYAAAQAQGWTVLRVPTDWVLNGRAAEFAKAIAIRGYPAPAPPAPAGRKRAALRATVRAAKRSGFGRPAGAGKRIASLRRS